MENNNSQNNLQEMKNNIYERFDLMKTFRILWARKVFFMKLWVVTFLLSCMWILPKPRYYTAQVSVAPETSAGMSGGGLSSLASSFGVNIDGLAGNDAIYPELYPDLIASNEFIVSMLDTKVKTLDGSLECDLYTYMDKHQKCAYYEKPIKWLTKKIRSLTANKSPIGPKNTGNKIDPFFMTKRQTDIVEILRKCIGGYYNRKTDVITITVKSQDPLISATLAENVSDNLQKYITDYRTNKARKDAEYYSKMVVETKAAYDEAVAKYSNYCDANQDIILQSAISERDKLEAEMELHHSSLQTFKAQLMAAEAKVQECTPVFTVLQGATVPLKASAPKRMLFVAFMLFLVTFISSIWLAREEVNKLFAAR